jgi:hypothetical protein
MPTSYSCRYTYIVFVFYTLRSVMISTGAPFPHVGGHAEEAHVKRIAALQAAHPLACMENGNKQMLQSVGTVAVAHDMARIVEALGEDGLNYLG